MSSVRWKIKVNHLILNDVLGGSVSTINDVYEVNISSMEPNKSPGSQEMSFRIKGMGIDTPRSGIDT
jgi:hypothetical protein